MNLCELMLSLRDNDVLMLVADWVIRLRKAATCRRELMTRWELERRAAPLMMSDTLNTKYFICGIRIYPLLHRRSGRIICQPATDGSSFNQITELCLKKGWKPPFEGTTRDEFISSVRFLMNNEDIIEY
jgi:hypothetical protein|tara:strand:+ start:255 stop:641 length:387 start_codon:yes stop_codon:yes gene_type:complete